MSYALYIHKVELVSKEAQAKYSPHIIGEIGIIEMHRPTLLGWRETAKHQQTTAFGKKRLKGMTFDGAHIEF